MNNFQYIKDALDEQNKSISWLAKEIGVSKGYISKLLNNKVTEPGSAKITAIHHALDIVEQPIEYEKNAYLIDVGSLSAEKYVYIATKCINETYDIFILIDSKNINKKINLKRFYDYLNFTNSKVHLVNESELKKALSKTPYTNIVSFNNEFAFLKGYNIVSEEISDKNVLQFRNIRNRAILLLSNNQDKLSILLNVLKLKTNYLIDDFSIFKDVNKNSNSLINNQLNILEQIHRSCQNSRIYIIGNEYLFFQHDSDVSELKKGLINTKEYLALFDQIYVIDFLDNSEISKQLAQRNNKIVKLIKTKNFSVNEKEILKIADAIIDNMEGVRNEN